MKSFLKKLFNVENNKTTDTVKSFHDAKAKEWNDDAILIGVAGHEFKSTIVAQGKTQRADKERGDGKCMMWMYEYHSTSADKDYFVFTLDKKDTCRGSPKGSDVG